MQAQLRNSGWTLMIFRLQSPHWVSATNTMIYGSKCLMRCKNMVQEFVAVRQKMQSLHVSDPPDWRRCGTGMMRDQANLARANS
jgi:hypothetical protein